jgi:zinc transport system permease protein
MGEVLRELFLPGGILFVPFLVGCMGSVAFGIVGSYVTVRRLNSSAVAISHSVLAGIGLAVFLHYRYQWAWCTPLLGAFLAAVVSALIIGRVTLRARHLGDSVTSSVMVIGMAAGLLLLKKTPGYFEPMSVLFGDTLLVSSRDLWVIGGIDALAVFCGTVFYRRLLAICFDEEYARLRGLRTDAYFYLLLTMTALTVVAMMQIVGIIMVIALLTLPSLTALLFARKLWHCMVISTLLCMTFVTAGLGISFPTDLPSGPVIVMLAGTVFLVCTGIVRLHQRMKTSEAE